MKNIILIITAILLTLYIFSLKKNINDLEADLSHLNNTIDITVDKAINDAKKHVTDSLLNEFNQREPITETKIKIQYKYDTIIDSIVIMNSINQIEYIKKELNTLYSD